MKRWTEGMRDAFSRALYEVAKEDSRVILITSDTGAICHDLIKTKLSNQYINVGIAEQNLIGVATGLAMAGKIPFTYAIVPFVTMRCYEQIRVDVCCPNLPVTMVGVGAGYDYNTLGPTHHGTDDIALMRALPGMTILSPSDSTMAAEFARMACKLPGPKYIRLDRTGLPLIYKDEKNDFSDGLTSLKSGKDLCIVATGRMSYRALEIAEKLKKHSIDAGVVDLYRIKPINKDLLLKTISDASHIATLEEHFVTGGIGSAVSEIFTDNNITTPLFRMGIPDKFCRQYGSRDDLLELNKIDIKNVIERASKFVRR